MIYIDKYAYFNNMKNIHPLEKFIFAISTLIIVLSANSIIISISVFLLVSLIILFKASIPFKFYIKILTIPVSFLLIGVLTIALNLISNQSGIIFAFNFFNLKFGMTSASFHSAVFLFFKTLGSVTCLYFLTLTVPVVELINIMKSLKIPKLFLELMVLIYRFIFVLFDTFDKIHTSQVSRLGNINIRTRFKSMGKLIASLFVISLKKSDDIYNALESRCYNGEFNFLMKEYTFSLKNIFVIVIIESLLIIGSIALWGKF
jgi:cobalt/nickel transport system permease protein